jgi:hypothetical protein
MNGLVVFNVGSDQYYVNGCDQGVESVGLNTARDTHRPQPAAAAV